MSTVKIHEVEQGSEEWLQLRCGLITASHIHEVLAKGKGSSESKTRSKYKRQLAAQRITSLPSVSFKNEHMQRGNDQEADARSSYETRSGCTVTQVGFITNDLYDFLGCSPDGLIADNGGIEIKSRLPEIQIEFLFEKIVPREAQLQIQFNLMLTDREFYDYVSYSPGLPLGVVRVQRNEEQIKIISDECSIFNTEVNQLVTKVKGLF